MKNSIDKLTYKGVTYIFKEPLVLDRQYLYDGWNIYTQFDDLIGVGLTIEEAYMDLSEDLHHLYNRLMEIPDDKLGEHMLKLKNYFKSNITIS